MRLLLLLASAAVLAGSAYGSKCGLLVNPCQNGGQCYEWADSHRCDCFAGFTGVNCEIDINECANQPCRNGGTCTDWVNGYSCSCTEGWGGYYCEENISCESNPCLNYGDCRQGNIGYWCICPAGFTGVNCGTEIFECDSLPCQNGGACNEDGNGYECVCTAYWTGVHCETSLNACGYYPCQNGATCVNRGTDYVCVCVNGYTGDDCDEEINECASLPCQNGGRCINEDAGYRCECTVAYTGTNCEELGLCTDIEGTWYNSCNDMVTLSKTSTGMVLGQYATYADRTAGYIEAECWSDPVGRDYRGYVSVSRSGKICQDWSSQYPHTHTRTPDSSTYADAGLGDHNYCRNPDGEQDGPWCYTTDPDQRWEYCAVPGPDNECSNNIPTILVGYVSNSIERPSFGFTVVQNQGDSTTSWTGQCHWCDGREVLMTTWIRTELANHCWEVKDANKVGTDAWTRYQQSAAPAYSYTSYVQDNKR